MPVEGQTRSFTARLLEFENPVRDIGEVRQENGAIKLDFNYTNISDKPVVILDIHSQCGLCLNGKFDTKPLQPGKSSKVAVTFDPETKYGEFKTSLTVIADNGDYRKFSTLTVSGSVTGEVSIEDQKYIFRYSDALRSDKRIVGMRLQNSRAKEITAVLEFYNASDQAIKVSFEHSSPYLKKMSPITLAPREIREVTFTLYPKYIPEGPYTIPVDVRVDGKIANDIIEVMGMMDTYFFSPGWDYR